VGRQGASAHANGRTCTQAVPASSSWSVVPAAHCSHDVAPPPPAERPPAAAVDWLSGAAANPGVLVRPTPHATQGLQGKASSGPTATVRRVHRGEVHRGEAPDSQSQPRRLGGQAGRAALGIQEDIGSSAGRGRQGSGFLTSRGRSRCRRSQPGCVRACMRTLGQWQRHAVGRGRAGSYGWSAGHRRHRHGVRSAHSIAQ
jgi:hypothetical protein